MRAPLRRYFSIIMFLLPRVSATYPFYLIPTIIATKFNNKGIRHLGIFFFFCVVSYFINSVAIHLSITAFLLSAILQLPFFLFLFPFETKLKINSIDTMRAINLLVLILSVINLTRYGFPIKLPYINYAPDRYSALYGQGGAKIVTIIGFFGFTSELFLPKNERKSHYLIFSLLNFIVPNYLTGIIMGVGAMGLVSARKGYLLIVVILIGVIVGPYALSRFSSLNSGFATDIGFNPKIFAYISVFQLYVKYPLTIFFGTGLGQFTSTPALWASPYIVSLSTHDVPNLPGLSMSDYHNNILGPVLSLVSDDSWSLSSSANKPYSSVTTILSEYGLVGSIIIAILFIKAFRKLGFEKRYVLTIFFFIIFMFGAELWHDSLWMGYMLVLTKDISKRVT